MLGLTPVDNAQEGCVGCWVVQEVFGMGSGVEFSRKGLVGLGVFGPYLPVAARKPLPLRIVRDCFF